MGGWGGKSDTQGVATMSDDLECFEDFDELSTFVDCIYENELSNLVECIYSIYDIPPISLGPAYPFCERTRCVTNYSTTSTAIVNGVGRIQRKESGQPKTMLFYTS